ncbi:MAG: YciI family protein [Thermoanaerobaculia bacterium]
MEYLLLIYSEEKELEKKSPADYQALSEEYGRYTQEITQNGNFKGGNPLQPTATATTVRLRGGKVLKTDGPFAETKEQLGGYYLVDAKDLDEAIALAARVPSARFGSIEVRPIQKM